MSKDKHEGEFSVYLFQEDGTYTEVCRFVSAEKAMEEFVKGVSKCQLGDGHRVIITDGGDMTNAEWEVGKGLIYPTEGSAKQ
jgi:hypothetical protein